VRRFYDLWNARDIERMAVLFDARAIVYGPEGWPDASPFRGPEAIAVGICALLEGFGEATISLEEISAAEHWVMTSHHAVARGVHSGLVAEFQNSASSACATARSPRFAFTGSALTPSKLWSWRSRLAGYRHVAAEASWGTRLAGLPLVAQSTERFLAAAARCARLAQCDSIWP
jgi:hypothetical protein